MATTEGSRMERLNVVRADKPEEHKNDDQESDVGDHPVFKAVKECSDDSEKIRNFFEIDGLEVNVEDSCGMTPLMHACWKGHLNVVKFLIGQGADPNGGRHGHDYTTLHFAALQNAVEICRVLLGHGVNAEKINSVGRTAAQMAGFVGNHDCVCVINNYVPKDHVYHFTNKQPLEDQAKLPLELAKPIYSLVMSMNTHPVYVAMQLKENPVLLENIAKVSQVLQLMSDREFKNRRDVNEVLSLKFHILFYIVKDIQKQMNKYEETEKKTLFIDRYIKSMLVGRGTDGYPVFQENFLRQGVKEFPYQESQLFKALVANFHHCKNYGDGVTAAEYINQSFNGNRGFKDFENCDTCGSEKAMLKCSNCKSVQYCNRTCQKFHWFTHKNVCPKLKDSHKPAFIPVKDL